MQYCAYCMYMQLYMHTVYTSYSLDSAAVSTIIFTTSSTIIVEIFISSYVRTSYAVLEDVVLLVHIVLLYDSILLHVSET